MSFSPFDGEKHMGSINMQTAASKNLVFTVPSSSERFAGVERRPSFCGLYQAITQKYPEWRDTLDEIEHRELRASRSTVAVAQRAPEETNLVTMPPPRRDPPMTARAEKSQPPARVIKFPIRTPSTPEQNERRQGLEPLDNRRIVSEKLYEMFLSALDDEPVNRDLVEDLYRVFLRKRKQG